MQLEIFDDVAAYLVLAPLAIVLGLAALAAIWVIRHRPDAVKRSRISH
jgi:hypothetical protein